MLKVFKAITLLLMLFSMALCAFAQQAPSQGMSLQQFQQWMQQQNPSPPASVPVTEKVVTRTVTTVPSQVVTQTSVQSTGTALPPPGAAILPPPGSQPEAASTTQIPVPLPPMTEPLAQPSATTVPLRNETIQFNGAREKLVLRPTSTVRRVYRRAVDKPLTYAESRRIMLRSMPPSLVPPVEDSQYVFDAMLQQNMPLTPEQVVKLRQQIDVSQRAAATPPLIPPKPISTTLMINLAPGTTPPAVRLALGYVTSLVFVDSTGAPWPIAAFDIGNPKSVNIQWDGKSNILLIQAVTPYSYGDMVIRLVGLATPITLELVSGQRVVDYRVDLHVSGIGPNTKDLPLDSGLPNSANVLLLNVLDGVAPTGSKVLIVRGADSQAWLLGDRIFLRTRMTVLSPGWVGKMVSPDGMQAYELPKTSSVLISRYGEPAELKIEGF